jgi:ribonuclease T1
MSGTTVPRRLRSAAAVGVALLLGLVLAGCARAGPTTVTVPPTAPASTTTPTAATPESGLPVVAASALPREARDTLVLIDRGGPYPYAKDGAVFGNVERLLPARPRGYYREYTVRTPGEADRGARRIVAGTAGDRYWTDDHYETFRQVRR